MSLFDTCIDDLHLILNKESGYKLKALVLFKLIFINSDKNINVLLEISKAFRNKLIKDAFTKKHPGYLYCLHNEIFDHYGEMYKLGRCIDTNDLFKRYGTYYPSTCKILAKSKLISNYKAAESFMFYLLREHRMEPRKEFFQCSIEKVKSTMDLVYDMFLRKETNEVFIQWVEDANCIYLNNIICFFRELLKEKEFVDLFNCYNMKEADYGKLNYRNKVHKISKNDILTAPDIYDSEYEDLMKNKKLNVNEKAKLKKYYYKKILNVDELTVEILDMFYNRIHIIQNIKDLSNDSIHQDDKTVTRIKMIKEIIELLGFNDYLDSCTIVPREQFIDNIRKVIKQSMFFVDPKKTKRLFNLSNKSSIVYIKIDNVKETSNFIKGINNVLYNYGLKIKTHREWIKGKNNIGRWEKYRYSLQVINDFAKYINN